MMNTKSLCKISFSVSVIVLALSWLCKGVDATPEVIKLKFATYLPPSSRQVAICKAFLSELKAHTDGKVHIEFFGHGSLLNEQEMIEGVELGIAAMGLSRTAYTPDRFPVTELFHLPLGFPSAWVGNHVVNDFYHAFTPNEWDGVHILWFHTNTPNVIISTTPVRKLEDLVGLTIRAQGAQKDLIRRCGARALSLPISTAGKALKTGVIDGVLAPFAAIRAHQFEDAARYITASWQVGTVHVYYMVMNTETYHALPPDVRTTLDRLSEKYRNEMAMLWNRMDFEARREALTHKMEIFQLSDEEVKKWKEAAMLAIEEHVNTMVASGYIESEIRGWLEYIRGRIQYWTQQQIEQGLKSLTGPDGIRLPH